MTEHRFEALLRMDLPEIFPHLIGELNSPQRTMATWHEQGSELDEFSDVFIRIEFMIHEGGELFQCSDDLSAEAEEILKKALREILGTRRFEGIVWLANL